METIIEKELKTKQIPLSEIYNTVVDVVIYGFNISQYYKNSFVYKIYCKLAVSYTKEPKKRIAEIGGFRGKRYEMSVDRAINKYNQFYQNDKLFEKVTKVCKARLHDSNNIEDTYREKLLDEIQNKCEKVTDDKLQEVLSIIQEKL